MADRQPDTNDDVGDPDTALNTNTAGVNSPLGHRTPPPSQLPTSEALAKSTSAPYPRFAPISEASSSHSAELSSQEVIDRSNQVLSECRSRNKRSLPTTFTYDPPAIKRADRVVENDSDDSASTSTSSVPCRAVRQSAHRDEDEDYVQKPAIQTELFYDDSTVIAQTTPTSEETVGDRPLPQITPISEAITADLTGAMLLEASTTAPQTVFIFNDLYVQFHQRQVYFSWPCPETGVMQRGEKVTKENWDILRIETVARKNAGLPSIGQFFGEAVAAATREHRAGRNRRTISSKSAVTPAPVGRAKSTGVESGPPSANRTPCAICGRHKGVGHMRMHDATDRPFMCTYGCKLMFFNALGVLKTHTWLTHKCSVVDDGRRQREKIIAEGKSLECPHCKDNSCTSVKELEKHCRALHAVKKPKRSTTTLEAPTQPHVENDMEEPVTDTAEKETTPVPEEVAQQVNEPGTSSESTASDQSESTLMDARRKEQRIKTLEYLIANGKTYEMRVKYLDLLEKVRAE